ncbi:PAS domain S-box protein [Nostoc sp. UIC 10890]
MTSLYTADLPSLEQVIEFFPLTVLPNTPLTDVITLMNPVSCDTVESATNFSSCVLVVEEKKLVGIFTLRDIARLTGARVDLSRVLISEMMTQPVISLTLTQEQNAFTALSFMRQHRICYLPVVDDLGQLVGLITQDRIRQVLQPAHLLKLRCVKEVMVTQVIHALPTTSVLELSQIMSEHRISCVVIIAQQKTALIPVGMITEKDIIKVQLQGLDITQTQAQAVMSTPVLSISPTESLWTVHQLMQERGVRRLAVVGEQGQLQGLVTQTNLLQVLEPLETVKVIQVLQEKVAQQTLQLRQTNQQLEQEVKQRRQVEESLRQEQQKLELRVAERTAELELTNARLQKEIEDHKKAQALLQQREHEWQALFDHALDAIAIADDEGRYVNVNPAACNLFGLSKEELLGSTIADFAEPGFDFTQAWQQFREQGQMSGEFRLHRQDGTVRETEFAAVANYIPHRHLSILRDVSDRQTALRECKQAEDAFKESEEQLQLALLAAHAGTWNWNIPNDEVIWSESVFDLFGLTRETFNGKFESFLNCVHPEDRKLVTNAVQQAINAHIFQYRVEFRLVKPDGTIRWAEGIGRVFYNEVAQPLQMTGIVIDITARKQSEAAFIDSEQRLQAIIDNSPAVIYVKDMQGQHILVNSEFERLTHLTREKVKNKTDYEIFSADIAQGLSKNDQQVLTSVIPLQSEEILQFDDGLHTYLSVKFPLCHSDGQPYAICGISTDITEKKQIEQQFYRAQRLESIGTLASGIAHDLNNVFTPIIMISQVLPLRCKNVDTQTQELFKILETSSKRGADLIKQILTFARGTEGKRILLQPGHLLKELVKVIKQTFLQSIEIVANIPTNTLWMVQADPTQLEQVFMNLAVNARDAMPNGGTLTITAKNRIIDSTYARMHLEAQAGSYIVVTISDTGTGIPPEIEERIFEPFFTTKEVGKGTGLGLSTVSGIVKNHGGFIEVATRVGKGTKFQIFLPKAEGTASEITIEAKLPRGKGELILVVDDEAVIQQITQQTLADYNYKTFVANDGIEAIALYVQYKQQISVVLLDMLMPNMDGLTAIRTLRTMNPNVKIIASSGLPTYEQKAIEAGADKFLYKPYTAKDLLTTLSDVIGD